MAGIGKTQAVAFSWQPAGESHYSSRRRKSLSRGAPLLRDQQAGYATRSASRVRCSHAGERNRHRTIQLLLGHSNIAATANYLRLATTQVCSATSPLDLLPRVIELPTEVRLERSRSDRLKLEI